MGAPMLYRLGKGAVRFRWFIIVFWVVVFVALAPFAFRVSSNLKAGFGNVATESDKAIELVRDELGIAGSSVTLLFYSDSLSVDDSRYQQEMESVLASVGEMPQVREVVTAASSGNPNMVSVDGRTVYVTVFLDAEYDEAMDLYPALKERAQDTEHLQVWSTGSGPIFAEIRDVSESDLRRAEMITFPLVLVALVLVFGGLVAAGLPVALGGASVAVTLGLLYFVALGTNISIFALNLVSLLGLGIAIDYSLLIVNRFREEMRRRPREEAVAHTVATAGRAILFSGATSALGLSGLLLFRFMMLRSLGLGGIMVVLVSLLVALTLLPAVLAVVGERVDALSILPRRAGRGEFWHRLASWVMRHPIAVTVPLVLFLLFLGVPALGIKIGAPWSDILPPGAEAREGWDVASRELGPGELSPLVMVARSSGNIMSPENVGTLYDLAHKIADDQRVERVRSVVSLDPRVGREQYQAFLAEPSRWPPEIRRRIEEVTSEHITVIQVYSRYEPMGEETKALLQDVRSLEPGGDITIHVMGSTAGLVDSIDAMYGDFPKVILYVLGTIYLALLVLFRSVVLPLKAVAMNAMSIFASYGALVFVFQQGHFEGLLGFEASGFLEPTIPIIMFCILFGLSMDYEVFLLSRVKESYDRSGDNKQSVAEGLERTGRIITSAALILILVAGSFATGEITLIKALGIGIAVAIFLDVSVVRALLVPALMHILGDWNWWAPRFLQRWLPRWYVPD